MKDKIDEAMMAKLLRALPGLKERAKTLVELAHKHGCLAIVDAVTSLAGNV